MWNNLLIYNMQDYWTKIINQIFLKLTLLHLHTLLKYIIHEQQ